MNQLHNVSRHLKSVVSKNCKQSLLIHQQRCMSLFDYGSNNLPFLQLDLSSYQQSLHDEDSFFIYDNTFGVADGVGGWNHVEGGNPKEFSRRIMANCTTELESLLTDTSSDGNAYLNAKDLLVRASLPVMQDTSLLGGSTALIGMLINKNILSICNVGDSRFYLFRRFPDRNVPSLYFISPEQRYSFNAPMQLSPMQYMDKSQLAVDPNLWSEYYELPTTCGDIIVFVTDGVSDNLFPYELNQIVIDAFKKHTQNTKELSKYLAQKIVTEAVNKQKGNSNDSETPFGMPKPDDTTCVVGVCVDLAFS